MPFKKYKAEQVVSLLRQTGVAVNGWHAGLPRRQDHGAEVSYTPPLSRAGQVYQSGGCNVPSFAIA
jgi:hypothetical protein